MDFSKVDLLFAQWANQAGLHVQTEYKGEEVRSTSIVDQENQRWQVWLVPVNLSDECVIRYWNYNDISRHSRVSISKLLGKLIIIERSVRYCTVKNT